MAQPTLVNAIPVLFALLALLFFWLAMRAGRRQRLIDDLPTSKTTGVFIGLVELKGTAETEQPFVSFLAKNRCVHYQWHVDEYWSRTVIETYTDSNGQTQTRTRTENGATTVAHGGESNAFYLKDDCGIIRIRPEDAKIEPRTIFDHTCGPADPLYYGKGPAGAVPDSDHRRRFVEYAIPLHAPLYVVGHAREREDIVAAEIAHDANAEMFLISTRSEEQVHRGFAWQYWLLGIFGVVFGIVGFVVRDFAAGHFASHGAALSHQFGPFQSGVADEGRSMLEWIAIYLGAGCFFGLMWLGCWAWMVFNSLVRLRQRVAQSWSNVDVQLIRRHDLIPNLVSIVQGMRDYEKKLQTELAQLRTQLVATPPGEPGPDPQALQSILIAVQERYPQLKADSSFLNLQRNLSETEERIALARGYFNEVAAFYNTRLERVPDRFVALVGAMKPRALLAADDFERAPIEVKLAT